MIEFIIITLCGISTFAEFKGGQDGKSIGYGCSLSMILCPRWDFRIEKWGSPCENSRSSPYAPAPPEGLIEGPWRRKAPTGLVVLQGTKIVPDAHQTLHSSPGVCGGELCNVWGASDTILVVHHGTIHGDHL